MPACHLLEKQYVALPSNLQVSIPAGLLLRKTQFDVADL